MTAHLSKKFLQKVFCVFITFSATVELDADVLVHVLGQVENVFALLAFSSLGVASTTTSLGSSATAAVASTSSAASEAGALRHFWEMLVLDVSRQTLMRLA